MKNEILKKSLIYRFLAFSSGLLIPILILGNLNFGITVGLVSQFMGLIIYYLFELFWRKMVIGKNGKMVKKRD